MRQSPGYDPPDLRFRQVRTIAPHLAGGYVTCEGPHPKRYRQSFGFRFLAEHGGHSVLYDLNLSQITNHDGGASQRLKTDQCGFGLNIQAYIQDRQRP